MKRFTDTQKWNDPWYHRLSPKLKCFWSFVCDFCDNAGVWKIDFERASFEIGEQITHEEVVLNFSPQRIIAHEDKMIVLKFIPFQFGNLNGNNNLHKSVVSLIENYLGAGLPLGCPRPGDQVKVKVKVKVKEEVKEEVKVKVKVDKGVQGEDIPDWLKPSWDEWTQHLKEKRCRTTPSAFKKQLEKLIGFGDGRAQAAIKYSIEGSYQGIFEPKKDRPVFGRQEFDKEGMETTARIAFEVLGNGGNK